jgi:hypothetical protein
VQARPRGDTVITVSLMADWFADGLDRLLPRTRFSQAVEAFMSLTQNALADLDAATTAVADRIDQLVASVGDLDQATADAIAVETARLRGLAADADNPVPDDPNA